MASVIPFEDSAGAPPVRGFLHSPECAARAGIVLAHGAGSNANAPLLVALAQSFAAAGITTFRCDLPFRQARPHGPPSPSMAMKDRAGLHRAVLLLRERVAGDVFLGGQSYGGRQASMLAADEPAVTSGLLLLSYPLHAPGRPAEPRTAHFPKLVLPSLFVHGTRDPFGSIDEMRAALESIAGRHELVTIAGAGHDLGGKKQAVEVARAVLAAFERFLSLS